MKPQSELNDLLPNRDERIAAIEGDLRKAALEAATFIDGDRAVTYALIYLADQIAAKNAHG